MRTEGGRNRAGGGRKEVAERSLVGAKEVLVVAKKSE